MKDAASGTMGVALTSCTVPAAGKPTFEIGDGEMADIHCPVLAVVGDGEGRLPNAQLEAFARASGGRVDTP